MSQKKARQKRQELRVQGIDTNKYKTPTPLINRRSRPQGASQRIWTDRVKGLFAEAQAREEAAAKPKRVRKTRSQQLAESMANHPAGKAKDA